MLDVNTFIGDYPYRHVPHPEPDVLVRVLEREGIAAAWVGHLPSAFHRDPSHGNVALLRALAPHGSVLRAAPIVRPDWPAWTDTLDALASERIAAIRAYPQMWGFAPGDARLMSLGSRCASLDLPIVLTVRFEDLRQRHPIDGAPDLSPAHVRELARGGTRVRIVVTAAGREFIEEVHWGLTPAERELVFWDISWIWGPPTDDLSHLLRSIGADRFVLGTMWPLRLAQTPRANLALVEDDVANTVLADPNSWPVR